MWGDTDHKRKFHVVAWDKIIVPKAMGGLGLRKLDVMNKACLSKLSWKLQTGSSDLWCHVLRGKYKMENELNNRACRGTGSSLWKTLMALNHVIQMFSYWIVGDGKSIDAWQDTWLDEGIVLAQHVDIPQHLLGVKLYELVDLDGRWNLNLMKDWMPASLMKLIAAVLPPNEEFGNDERVLTGGNKMNFSVSDMYMKLCGYSGEEVTSNWKKAWRINVPEKVRSFMWLMMHERLLTNALKNKMRLCHAMCNYCGDVEETILHAMRDCPKAREVWRYFVAGSQQNQFYMADFQQWININLINEVLWHGTGD
jgi:hypothetical protein